MSSAVPSRQIHLDFHTSEHIPDVGSRFDATEFARQMKDAHVNSVTVFAKCHHGRLYYDTARPERHPGLKPGLDLLGQQVEALHRCGIRAPIYLSVQCDEYAADTHPEWIALQPDGSRVGRKPFANDLFTWQILDMSSPYQDFLYEQTTEVLSRFKPVDGIFFDMCWDQISCSNLAKRAMLEKGFRPEDPQHRARHAHEVAIAYMKRFYALVKEHAPDAGCYFNSRPLWNMAEEAPVLTQIEVEALPTGGWGYMYFPTNVRFARNFGKPYLGMTARFHKSWADFGGLKPYAALEYEVSQMMAHGAQCSIGDQMHPRGTLDKSAYELIGRVYRRVADREPWLQDARPVTQIGVIQVPPQPGASPGASEADAAAAAAAATEVERALSREGVTRMLTQLKHQFDLILPQADFGAYELLVLPDDIAVDASLAAKLDAYVAAGGAVLATGTSGLSPDGRAVVWPNLPVVVAGGFSPFATTYMRFDQRLAAGVPDTDHVLYDRTIRVTPSNGAQVFCGVVEPYFDRTWEHFSSHAQTPGDKLSPYALATLKGRVAHIAAPVFAGFARHGNYPLRLLAGNLIDLLLPAGPLLTLQAPTSTEATVTRQSAPHRPRTIVHLLQYAPERRTRELDIVEDVVPLYDVALSLRLATPPSRVYSAPDGTDLPFRIESGRVELRVPRVNGHAMVVFE